MSDVCDEGTSTDSLGKLQSEQIVQGNTKLPDFYHRTESIQILLTKSLYVYESIIRNSTFNNEYFFISLNSVLI